MKEIIVVRRAGVMLFACMVILVIICICTRPARGADDTDVAVALALATAKHRTEVETKSSVPLAPNQQRTTDGTIIEFRGGYWYIVPQTSTLVGSGVPATSSFRNGCGCQPGHNCGASFCKARGGSGCPESCPVKK